MKLVFDKDIISDALETSCSILTKPSVITALNNVLIKVKNNTCTFSATDLTDIIQLKVALISGEDCEFLLNGKTALSLIKTLQKGDITLEIDGNQAVLKSGKFKASIPMASVEDFPKTQEEIGLDYGLKFKSLDLKNSLSFVSPFASSDLTRETFCGININYKFIENETTKEKETLVTLCATDGHRLAKTDLVASNLNADQPTTDGVIVSTKAVNIISKFFSPEQDIVFHVKDNKKAIFKSETITLTTSLINGTFPDFSSIIPKTTKNAVVNKNDLMSCLKRCSLLNPKTLLATFVVANNNIKVSSISCEYGSMSEDIECNYELEETILGMNSKYLEQSLSLVNDSFAVICFIDNDSPIKIISAAEFESNDDNSFSLIMPMQV